MNPMASLNASFSRLRPPDRLLLVGYCTVGFTITVFLSWAAIVPLADSIIAPGTVSVAAQRRTIEHLEGGAVSQLNVSEGDYVEKGQILLRLDDKDLQSKLDVLEYERFAHQAKLEHLVAERSGKDSISFDSTLLEEVKSNPQFSELLQNAIGGFKARRRAFETQSDLLEGRIRQGNDQLERLRQQLQSLERQQLIVGQQSKDSQLLLIKGYETKKRAAELRLDSERLLSRRFELEAEVDSVDGSVQDARIGKERLVAEQAQEVEENLSQTRQKLAELDGQIRTTRNRLAALDIRSNVRGVIVDLMIRSINDVIKPASPILDILPTDSAYLIEAQIPPDKIEGLVEGMEVEVRLRGLAEEQRPSMPGRVAMVSADIVDDPNLQHQYYRVHVSLKDWRKSNQSIGIMPGMPADVIFRKRDRTPIEYFLAPLIDHLSKSSV